MVYSPVPTRLHDVSIGKIDPFNEKKKIGFWKLQKLWHRNTTLQLGKQLNVTKRAIVALFGRKVELTPEVRGDMEMNIRMGYQGVPSFLCYLFREFPWTLAWASGLSELNPGRPLLISKRWKTRQFCAGIQSFNADDEISNDVRLLCKSAIFVPAHRHLQGLSLVFLTFVQPTAANADIAIDTSEPLSVLHGEYHIEGASQ